MVSVAGSSNHKEGSATSGNAEISTLIGNTDQLTGTQSAMMVAGASHQHQV